MSLDYIIGVCFLFVLGGSYPFIAVCNINYNYYTARYTCMDKGGSGTLLTLATFHLHKEWIIEELKNRSHKRQKYWIQKTQGLSSQNTTSVCNTQVDKCPYIEMKKGEILCNESRCNHKFLFLCETDVPFSNSDCAYLLRRSGLRALGRAKIDYPVTRDPTTPTYILNME